MKTAIYGAGAMGTVLGAYITRAGFKIDLINRNVAHIKGLKEKGAQIEGKIEFTQPVHALLPNEMSESYDIILLMTKQLNNQQIVESLLPFLKDEGVICTMQNGLPELSVANVIGEDRTLGCAMSWGATLLGDGRAELTSEPTRETLTFSIGKYGNVDDVKLSYIIQLLETMGQVTFEENFIGARWSKLLVNAAFSGLSVVFGATFGEIVDNKRARRLAQLIMKECIDVTKKAGIQIEPIQGKDIAKLMDYSNRFKQWFSFMIIPIAMKKHRNIKSSMLRDLSKGRLCEIEAINGVVCQFGDKVEVDTPVNDLVVDIVHSIERNELISSWENIKSFQHI